MALLPQQSDKIGGGLIYLSKEQKREVFFFLQGKPNINLQMLLKHGQQKPYLCFSCFEEDQDQMRAWQAHLWFFLQPYQQPLQVAIKDQWQPPPPPSYATINNSLKDQRGYTNFSFNPCHTSLWTHLNSHVWPKAG